ncbi:NADH-quinone oxidoreductase subunit NuoB [bacterium]|nr:NADH-quinone oxidoreductase subunit NuoB [bacterium]
MIKTLLTRLEQGNKTSAYPKKPVTLIEEYRGLPEIKQDCADNLVQLCSENCPQDAIDPVAKRVDLGKCVFCGACEQLSEGRFVHFTNNHELGVSDRQQLLVDSAVQRLSILADNRIKKLFGRSLQLRQVSAGGCNACEADVNVLGTPFFDLARFGIQFVASPRHADGMLVTGPVTVNMKTALLKTYEAIPEPKLVIATGACAISGGPFFNSPQSLDGVASLIPVDLFIPGCPPHPLTTLHALLQFLGKI